MNERVLSHLRVVMKDYPTKVLISKERRAKYFSIKDKAKLPLKYTTEDYKFKVTKQGIRLINVRTGELVIKNPGTAGKERYQVISGNEMFARTHERIRDKVVKSMKEYFRGEIIRTIALLPPGTARTFQNSVHISMQLYTQFGVANWDVDNLWIYHKTFYDTLAEMKLINNDNILWVRKGGGTEFIPIKEGETPRMEFFITEVESEAVPFGLHLRESINLAPGEIQVIDGTILLGTGRKKIIYGAAQKAIRRAMYYCLNNFYNAHVSKDTHATYKKFFECFAEHRVALNIE